MIAMPSQHVKRLLLLTSCCILLPPAYVRPEKAKVGCGLRH